MNKETIKRIRLIYSIAVGISAVIAGVCLIAACLGIYYAGGDEPYSRQIVAESFSQIAAPVYLCLVLVIGGFLLDFALPADNKKIKAEKNDRQTLDRLLAKRNLEICAPSLRAQIEKLRKTRKLYCCIGAALLAVCSILFLLYGANPANFHQSQINTSMVNAMWVMLPCLAVPFGWTVFTAYAHRASLRKEIDLVRQISVDPNAKAAPQTAKDPAAAIATVRWVLVAAAIVLLVYGYYAGGTADVLTKAVNICTECVGLG